MNELIKVNRFELIDHTKDGDGRAYVKWSDNLKIDTSLQDNNQTLKVFISDTKTPMLTDRNEVQLLYAYNLILGVVGDDPSKDEQEILDKLARIIAG